MRRKNEGVFQNSGAIRTNRIVRAPRYGKHVFGVSVHSAGAAGGERPPFA